MIKGYDVVIIGGGISGLSAAYFLEQCRPNLSSILIEATDRLGGWVRTIRPPSGQQYEAGPRSLRLRGEEALATVDLITSLGLERCVLKASKAASSRYVVRGGYPTALPEGLLDVFTSPIGRELTKKILLEPFQRRGGIEDESVASFFSRRAPSSLVTSLADALVSGIWGGDPKLLSMYQTFPSLKEDEIRYGSCVVGRLAALFQKKARPKIHGICTLSGGLEQLVTSINTHLRMPVSLQNRVLKLSSSSQLIEIETEKEHIRASTVILALPEVMTRALVPSLFGTDPSYPSASFATVVMGWKDDCLPKKGFGILAPSTEDSRVLGIVFDSSVFEELNTHMKTRLTVILGGTRWPEGIHESDDTLLQIALSKVAAWTGLTTQCDEYAVIRSEDAIPQPTIGRRRRAPYKMSECQRIFAIAPSIGGVSVTQCISSGYGVAAAIAQKMPLKPVRGPLPNV